MKIIETKNTLEKKDQSFLELNFGTLLVKVFVIMYFLTIFHYHYLKQLLLFWILYILYLISMYWFFFSLFWYTIY